MASIMAPTPMPPNFLKAGSVRHTGKHLPARGGVYLRPLESVLVLWVAMTKRMWQNDTV